MLFFFFGFGFSLGRGRRGKEGLDGVFGRKKEVCVFVQGQEVREDLGGVPEGGQGVEDWDGGVCC